MSLPSANAATHEVMAGWNSGKPVAALMGEFSSGKSTLLNFLLGEEVATTKVTATPLPPIWFTQSDTPFVTALCEDGSEVDVDLGAPDINYREKYLVIRVGHPSEALKTCDIIDAPGLSDPDLTKDALRFLYRYFSFVIWCTAAAQAWRQTEKAAYEKLAASTKANSLLVITRADKLRFKKDQEKVFKRVHGETKDMFGEVLVLKTPKAAAVDPGARTDAKDGPWVETGGHAFTTALAAAIATNTPGTKSNAKSGTKSQEAPSKAAKPAAAKPARKKPKQTAAVAKAAKPAKTKAKSKPSGTIAADLIAAIAQIKTMPENNPDCSQIEHLIAAIDCDSSLQQPGSTALRACTRIDSNDLETERYVSQIRREINAFSQGSSIRLDT